MLNELNPIPFKARVKEFAYDYLVILAYLVLLFGVTVTVYLLFLGGVPQMSELQSQLVALVTSVIPIVLIFTDLDYAQGGSFGKKKAGLKLAYRHKSVKSSLLRNIVKFLPWQLGHMSTIHGIYTDYDLLAVGLSCVSITLAALLLLMTLLRKDKRHLGDLLAGTQVQVQ